MNLPMLKGKLREYGKTYADLACIINKSVTTVTAKMNGKVEFDCAEACLISDWLNLTIEERVLIFLTKNLHGVQL